MFLSLIINSLIKTNHVQILHLSTMSPNSKIANKPVSSQDHNLSEVRHVHPSVHLPSVFRDKDPKTMTMHERNLFCAAIALNSRLSPYCPAEAMDSDPDAVAKYTAEYMNFMKGPYRLAIMQQSKKEMAAFVLKAAEELKNHLENVITSAQTIMNEEIVREVKEANKTSDK